MRAAVLAGGPSRRFGEDKLLFEIRGKPVILHVIDRLRRVASIDEVYVIASSDRVEALEEIGVDNIIEDNMLVGPAGAVLIALRRIGDAFIAAGDMPLISPKLVDHIISKYLKHGYKYYAYVPGWLNGYLEPLHGVYTEQVMAQLKERVERKEYSLQELLRSLKEKLHVVILDGMPEEYRLSVYNVNTREDLEKVRRLMNS